MMKKMNWIRLVAKMVIASVFVLAFLACPNNPKNDNGKNNNANNGVSNKKGAIVIKSVTLDSKTIAEKGEITVDGAEADLKIEFAEKYAGLAVKVGTENATLNDKVASFKVKGITEAGIEVKIEATATGKDKKEYKFTAKKKGNNNPTDKTIVITSVTLDKQTCNENAEITVDGAEADLKIEFAEKYAGLAVKVGTGNATLNDKVASFKVKGITEAGIEVKIEATATGKDKREYKFTAKKKGGGSAPSDKDAKVASIAFEGKEINSDPGAFNNDKKEYSTKEAPFLSEITADGKHKVGTVKLPNLKVRVRYEAGTQEPTFKLENKTTNKSENGVAGSGENNLTASIKLQKGDNNIEITYSEKGKTPAIYKVIVEYAEPEYAPISGISFGRKSYTTEKALEELEAGSEAFSVEGKAEVVVKVVMPELWYDEDGWSLKIAGDPVAKGAPEFKKGGVSIIIYTATKIVPLNKAGSKEVDIEFANTARSYTKTYKANITHVALNKIDFVRIINEGPNKQVDNDTYANFKFDSTKNYYKANDVALLDVVEKATFLINPEDKDVAPKYIFSDTDALPQDSASWQTPTKMSITYVNEHIGNQTVETYVVKNHEIKTGSEFLFVLLEKDGIKTYYCKELRKVGIPADNTDKLEAEFIYQDENATKIEDHSPLAKKGFIRVKPKSSKATVNLLTPTAQAFTKSADGWHECTIALDSDEVVFTYEIVAENTTSKRTYNDATQKFTRNIVLKDFQFAYKENPISGDKNQISELDGKRFIGVDKDEVKSGNKLYFFLETFKGVTVEDATDFANLTSEELPNNSTLHKFSVDIASVMASPSQEKHCVAKLKLSGKEVGNIDLNIFLSSDDVIRSLYVHNIRAEQVSNDKYICKGKLADTYNKKIAIELYLPEGKKGDESPKLIKVFKESQEINMTKKAGPYELTFLADNFAVASKEKIILTIKYWDDGANVAQAPTNTYTLEIEDI